MHATSRPASDPASARLAQALRCGLAPGLPVAARMDPPAPTTVARVVHDPLAAYPAGTHEAVARCAGIRAGALQAALEGEVDRAASLLARARRALAAVDLPPAARLRETALDAGVASYLAYRRGRWAQAERVIDVGAEADAEAAWVHGAIAAEGHRIQLEVNRLRVRCRAGDVLGAAAVGAAILDRAAGAPDALPSRSFPLVPPDAVATLSLAALELGAVEQLIATIPAIAPGERGRVLAPLWCHLDTWGAGRVDRGRLYLHCVRARGRGDVVAFVDAATLVLGRGPSGSRPVWRALVAEVESVVAQGMVTATPELVDALRRGRDAGAGRRIAAAGPVPQA